MDSEKLIFIQELVGVSADKAAFEGVENAKREALDNILGGLTDEAKEQIRAGMKFQVVDKKGKKHGKSMSKDGQEHEIDTHDSVSKGRGLSKEDQPRVQKAMDQLVEIITKAKNAKGPDGKPLFGTQELIDNIYTPLVRERLMPENLVMDKYSEVNELIQAAMAAQKETFKEEKDDEEMQLAKMEADFCGAGGKLDMLQATVGTLKSTGKSLIAKLGIDEKAIRRAGIVVAGVKAVGSTVSAGIAVEKMASGATTEKMEVYLNSSDKDWTDYLKNKRSASEDKVKESSLQLVHSFAESLESIYPSGSPEIQQMLDRYTDILATGAGDTILSIENAAFTVRDTVQDFMNDKVTLFVTESLSTAKDLISTIVGGITEGDSMTKAMEAMDKNSRTVAATRAVQAAAKIVDAELTAVLKGISSDASDALAGVYLKCISVSDAISAASNFPKANAVKTLDVFASAFATAFAMAAPSVPEGAPTDGNPATPIIEAGRLIKDAFHGAIDADKLKTALTKNPLEAFGDFRSATRAAASAVLAPGKPVVALFTDRDICIKMVDKCASDPADQTKQLEDLEAAQNEIAEYERSLVLIDEGGVSVAEQRSIERLIGNLKEDKKKLEFAANLGSNLLGISQEVMPIVNTAGAISHQVLGEIVGPLKAAKLILQLSVNLVKAAERWRLWYKFKTDLERSKKAVSALTSTIQGFFDNKKEQIAFRTIEDALIAVQIAASIMGSIPEPFTMAAGKTMAAVATAAEAARDVSEKIYNEAMLSKAWNTTRAAMNNPGNRKLGLKALRLNPTLAMHAVAWAGMQKRDPIARMVLNSVGLNEQSLEVSGGNDGERKVREYLEALLDEDRQIRNEGMIDVAWLPPSMTLCAKDWFLVTKRASRDASPKLRLGGEAAIMEGLKRIDQHDRTLLVKFTPDTLLAANLTPEQLLAKRGAMAQDAGDLYKALDKFDPKTSDGSEHEEMQNVTSQYLKLSKVYLTEIANAPVIAVVPPPPEDS